MTAILPITVIAITIALNALYVAAEFATVGSRLARVQESATAGSRSAARLVDILTDSASLDAYVATCQVSITLTSLVAGAYGQSQLAPLLEPALGSIGGRGAAIIIVLILITVFQVVLGELLPKTAALRYPEQLAIATLTPMRINQWLFRPLVVIFNGSAFRIMKAAKLNVDHSHTHVHSPEELVGLYRASAEGGLIDAAERDMLAGILNVEGRIVREIMTPRTRLVTVAGASTIAEALTSLAHGPHSRFPVTDGDDVVGIVELRDLHSHSKHDPSVSVSEIAREVVVVGEFTTVPSLWRTLRDQTQHCALVVNEYGDVAGLVTLEDALEEIFGEVQDEFDEEAEPVLHKYGRVSVRGDVLVSELDEWFGIRIDAPGVDTLSGLAWHRLGRTPIVGDTIDLTGTGGPELRIDAMARREVTRASFIHPDSGDRPASGTGESTP